jgi:hypothetical protein
VRHAGNRNLHRVVAQAVADDIGNARTGAGDVDEVDGRRDVVFLAAVERMEAAQDVGVAPQEPGHEHRQQRKHNRFGRDDRSGHNDAS